MPRETAYDYEEFQQLIGGWLNREDKPTPRRTDRAFRILAALTGIATTAGSLIYLQSMVSADLTLARLGTLAFLALVAGGMAYGFARAFGMVVVGIVSMIADGPEWTMNWRLFRHDIKLRATWAMLLESLLFFAAAGMLFYSAIDAWKHHSAYSAAVFVLIACMTWWPFLRHRIRSGRWPEQQ